MSRLGPMRDDRRDICVRHRDLGSRMFPLEQCGDVNNVRGGVFRKFIPPQPAATLDQDTSLPSHKCQPTRANHAPLDKLSASHLPPTSTYPNILLRVQAQRSAIRTTDCCLAEIGLCDWQRCCASCGGKSLCPHSSSPNCMIGATAEGGMEMASELHSIVSRPHADTARYVPGMFYDH